MNIKTGLFLGAMALFAVSGPDARADTLDKIKRSGTLTLGFRAYSIPFSYLDALYRPIGYAKDICDRVAAHIQHKLDLPKLAIKYYRVKSSDRLELLSKGTIDLECGTTSMELAQTAPVDFSYPYFLTEVRFVSRIDMQINTLDDLVGKRVGTTRGATPERLFRRAIDPDKNQIEMYHGNDHTDSFLMLRSGYIAAFVMDEVILHSFVANSKDPNAYKISEILFGRETYGIMMRKNDDALKKLVNEKLRVLMASGEAETLYNRWFNSPIPPFNNNLQRPLPVELREIFNNAVLAE